MSPLPAVDAYSIALFIWLISSVLASGMLLLARLERTHHGLGFWAVGEAVFGLGMLFLLIREVVPIWLSIALGNAGIFGAFVLLRAGFQRFRARATAIRFDLFLALAAVVALVALWALDVELEDRVALAAAVFGVLSMRCVTVLARPTPGFAPVFRSLQAVFAVIALLAGMRFVLALSNGAPSSSLFDGSGLQTLVYLALGIMALLVPFLLLLLNSLRNLDRLRTAQAEAESAATTDYLTGLANRRSLFRELKAMPPDTGLAVCLIDLDDFKRVNDEYGHSTGDRVLAELGHMLRSMLADDETAVRLGGEEFAIVSTGTGRERAHRFAEMLRATVERELAVRCGLSRHITCSIGVSEGRAGSIDETLGRADAALYLAKRSGKNRVAGLDGSDRRLADTDRRVRIRDRSG